MNEFPKNKEQLEKNLKNAEITTKQYWVYHLNTVPGRVRLIITTLVDALALMFLLCLVPGVSFHGSYGAAVVLSVGFSVIISISNFACAALVRRLLRVDFDLGLFGAVFCQLAAPPFDLFLAAAIFGGLKFASVIAVVVAGFLYEVYNWLMHQFYPWEKDDSSTTDRCTCI